MHGSYLCCKSAPLPPIARHPFPPLYMDESLDIPSVLACLTMNDISNTLPAGTLSRAQKRSCAKMEEAVSHLHAEQYSLLEKAAYSKKCRRVEKTEGISFLQPVSEECRQQCISMFIDATGNKAIATSVCAVCAGRFFDKEVQAIKRIDLQKYDKLSLAEPHRAHILTDGMLLHQIHGSLHTDVHGINLANVCDTCLSALQRDKTPPLSLANNMWIGEIPLELKVLTLPERILIARHFPAAYIVKLYPKKKGARNWVTNNLHSGL